MRNLFTPVALKIHALGFDEILKVFYASCWLWKHSCKVLEMLEEVVVSGKSSDE